MYIKNILATDIFNLMFENYMSSWYSIFLSEFY